MFILQISQNIDGFRQNNSQGFRIRNTLKKIAIREKFYFHYSPKLYIGFNDSKAAAKAYNSSKKGDKIKTTKEKQHHFPSQSHFIKSFQHWRT